METQSIIIELLEISLSEREELSAEETIRYVQKIAQLIENVVERKPNCDPGDKECQARCKRRNSRVLQLLRVTLPASLSEHSNLDERIDRIISRYAELQHYSSSEKDFFESDDLANLWTNIPPQESLPGVDPDNKEDLSKP